MPTQEYAASIQGVSIRVTRLDAAGNLLNGAGDSYVTSAFMRVSFTPEYEEGDEITEKNANGIVCVTFKAPDVLKRITMELAICEPDTELSQLLSGGLLLRKTVDGQSKSVGWAAPGVGDDPAGNGVAIEVWSWAVKDGKRASVLPYFHWVFPFVKMRQSGDRVIENGMLATTFEGYGLGNPNFGAGADGRWEFPTAAERPYSYARASWAPRGLQGFYTWSDRSTDLVYFTKAGVQGATATTISSVQGQNLTGIVTLSDSLTNANVVAGDLVMVTNVGTPFNTTTNGVAIVVPSLGTASVNVPSGTSITGVNTTGLISGLSVISSNTTVIANHTISSITNATAYVASSAILVNGTTTLTTPNLFSYTLTDNVGATVVTATLENSARVTLIDSVTESPDYVAVTYAGLDTKYANGTSTSTFNVPGNSAYNPDNNVDFIIKSNEE